jgi:beta-glucosidase
VGYRWYDARDVDVTFPFGHGLSYTTFSYQDAEATLSSTGDVAVTVTVTNTGDRAGREVVQVYTSLPGSSVVRPVRELKSFASVPLEAGESRPVSLLIQRSDLAYWDVQVDSWVVEGGSYRVEVAASSRDIRAVADVHVPGDTVSLPISRDSSLGEVYANPVASAALRKVLARGGRGDLAFSQDENVQMMLASFPIGRMGMFGLTEDDIDEFLSEATAAS